MVIPEIIACDLDGTLLLGGAQTLREDTCSLIRELSSRGIMFFAATGRQYDNIRRLFRGAEDIIGYLCENGCTAYYRGKRLFKNLMEPSLALEMIRDIESTPGAEVLVSGEHVSYIRPKERSYLLHVRDVLGNNVSVTERLEAIPEPYFKVSVYEKGGITDADVWERRFGDRATVVSGGKAWLDMMPKGVNKGKALLDVLSALGISPDRCLAIGDNDNDLEMLRSVGHPAAVASARPCVLAEARYVTPTVEDLMRGILAELE